MERKINAELLDAIAGSNRSYEEMLEIRDLLFDNSRREKTLKRFLEYCYMMDVKVAFEGLKGEKTRGLKAALKYAKEHDIGMTAEQIQGAMNI